MTEVFRGGCLCGEVRYEVVGKPIVCLACHCRFCQRFTGSAYSSVAYFKAEQVHIAGELKEYRHRSDETGRVTTLQFCGRCGTAASHLAEARPGWRGIEIGTLDEKAGLQMERHVWTRSKQPWTAIPDDVDIYDKGSADGAVPIKRAVRHEPY